LAEIAVHRCWDTTGIRGLTANTLGIELFDSLEFTQAALVYVDFATPILGGAVFNEKDITVSNEPGLGIKGIEPGKIKYLD
jgi:hypothetical protein